jgi:glycosyltransferase involved in cell wall biosynthesis
LLDDSELAGHLGERARALAMQQFTAERMAQAYENVYEEILSR